MKYILIGGSGFIGQHFLKKIPEEDILLNIDIDKGVNNTNFRFCDILDYESLSKIEISNHKEVTIIHLAAVHFDFQKKYFETNVDGTQNVLNFIDENSNIKKYVFFSSVATYGDSPNGKNEEDAQLPTNDYGKSKYEAEKIILSWKELKKNKTQVIIIRPAVVFGEYNFGNVFNLIQQIRDGFFAIIGNGKNVKSIAYAGNVADSVMYCLDQIRDEVFVYNYADYPQKSIYEQSKSIAKIVNKGKILFKIPLIFTKIITLPIDFFEKLLNTDLKINSMRVKKFTVSTYFHSDKIRERGFKQNTSIGEAISKTDKWIKSVEIEKIRKEWFTKASKL